MTKIKKGQFHEAPFLWEGIEMKRKYRITAYKENDGNGKWEITSFTIEAEDRTDAERKVCEKGYAPLSAQRFN